MSELAGEGEVLSTPEADAARGAQRGLMGRLAVLCALAVALGVALDLVREPTDPATERRSWSSPRADGFRGCAELASRLGHRVVRQTASWGKLPDPATHALVIVAPLPFGAMVAGADLDAQQVRALGRWVEEGGHVVVTPPGRLHVDLVETHLEDLAGGDDVTTALIGTAASTWPTALAAPLVATPPLPVDPLGLRALGPADELFAAAWLTWSGRPLEVARPRVGSAELPAFHENALPPGFARRVDLGPRPFVISSARGAGRVWLVASAYPFSNLALARGGSAPLVAGLLHEVTDGGRRTLVLDERSHGLGARRGMLGPLKASGLGTPVLALLALVGLVAWRGAVREGSPRPPRGVPRRAKEEFVVALADLLRRGRNHGTAAHALGQVWRERLVPLGAEHEVDRLLRAAAPLDDARLAELARGLRAAAQTAATAAGERSR